MGGELIRGGVIIRGFTVSKFIFQGGLGRDPALCIPTDFSEEHYFINMLLMLSYITDSVILLA